MSVHRTIRRGATAAAVATLLGVVAACGGGNSDQAGEAELTDTVPEDDITLKVWSFLPDNYEGGREAYQQVFDAFNDKYPNVTVELDNMAYPTYFDKVRNATVAAKGPDVITMYGGAQAYSYRNGLFPLQDSIQPDVADDLKFVDENYSRDGNLYILPTGSYGYAMLVNQDIFEQAGIDPETALGDWDTFLDTCTTLNDQGIEPISSGWKDGFMFETFMYMISSQMMDAETLKEWTAAEIPVDDEIFTTATQYILDMNDAGCFGGEEGLGRSMFDESFNRFYAGQAAMMVTGSLSTAETAYQSIDSTTVMRLPQVPDSQFETLIDAGAEAGWAITKWTSEPEAAAALVNFLASAEAQQILWDTVGVPPNVSSITVEGKTPIQEAYLPLIQDPENHTGFSSFPLPVLAVYERNASLLIGGEMTADEFTEQAMTAYQQAQ